MGCGFRYRIRGGGWGRPLPLDPPLLLTLARPRGMDTTLGASMVRSQSRALSLKPPKGVSIPARLMSPEEWTYDPRSALEYTASEAW